MQRNQSKRFRARTAARDKLYHTGSGANCDCWHYSYPGATVEPELRGTEDKAAQGEKRLRQLPRCLSFPFRMTRHCWGFSSSILMNRMLCQVSFFSKMCKNFSKFCPFLNSMKSSISLRPLSSFHPISPTPITLKQALSCPDLSWTYSEALVDLGLVMVILL